MQVAQIKDRALEIIAPVPYLHLDLHLAPVRHLCHDVEVSALAILPRGGELAIGVLEPCEARASIREHQGVDEVQKQMFPVRSSKEKLEKTIVKTIDASSFQILLGLAFCNKKRSLRINYVFVLVHIRALVLLRHSATSSLLSWLHYNNKAGP